MQSLNTSGGHATRWDAAAHRTSRRPSSLSTVLEKCTHQPQCCGVASRRAADGLLRQAGTRQQRSCAAAEIQLQGLQLLFHGVPLSSGELRCITGLGCYRCWATFDTPPPLPWRRFAVLGILCSIYTAQIHLLNVFGYKCVSRSRARSLLDVATADDACVLEQIVSNKNYFKML
jgi:hypothetical protein